MKINKGTLLDVNHYRKGKLNLFAKFAWRRIK